MLNKEQDSWQFMGFLPWTSLLENWLLADWKDKHILLQFVVHCLSLFLLWTASELLQAGSSTAAAVADQEHVGTPASSSDLDGILNELNSFITPISGAFADISLSSVNISLM